ncbi:MAG: YIP1 family protein, partial [Myxococcaceae bacterium]
SENEIQEKIEQAGRIRLVGGVAAGVVQPLSVLFAALVLMLTAWLLGLSAPFSKCFTAAAVAMLPVALFHLIFAVAAFRQVGLTEAEALTLVPSSLLSLKPDAPPKLARLLGAVDFFSLWGAVLLGLGFAQAAGMRKVRAVVVGLALYGVYAAAFLVGLPGLSGGRG